MAKQKFEIGQVVRLKSGGPDMTVESLNDYTGHYHCQWFGGRKLESGSFPPASLVEVEDDEQPKK